jgi:four helix bundle protein
MAQHYKNLVAWRKAMDLVEAVYRETTEFPKRETYSLTDQMRRAAVSVPSNIAEGQARFSRREFSRFLQNARGSLAELETQILIARRLHYLEECGAEVLLDQVEEVGRILNGLVNSVKVELVPATF